MLIESADKDPTEALDEVATFLADTLEGEDFKDDNTEFDTWLCNLLDLYDSNTQSEGAYLNDVVDLSDLLSDVSIHAAFGVNNHLLLDTGAPKTICSEDWLRQSNWIPTTKIPLPESVKPFRFAGQHVKPLYAACLVAEVTDIHGKPYIFRQVAFVLPPTPIPFLIGLQTSRTLAFDIHLREGNNSHLTITRWNATFPLVVHSHSWLEFKPLNKDPQQKTNWAPLIGMTLEHLSTPSINFCFPVSSITPPWEREGWNSNMNPDAVPKLHELLKHPSPTSLLDLYRRVNSDRKLPSALKHRINEESAKCKPCIEHASLPRTPKLSIPPPAMPNIAVTLDVMHHTVRMKKHHILVMLDTGDKMMRLSNLENDLAETSFNHYFGRWISLFDAPHYTVVDRGTNLAAQYMADQLRPLQSQLCPIPTEAPWSIGQNERSHAFIHGAIDKILAHTPSLHITRLLGEVEMAWNFTQHSTREIPHLHRFGVLPRIIGQGSDTSLHHRIAIMEQLRQETDRIRSENLITRSFNSYHRYDKTLRVFTPNQFVWFHRRLHGWRKGIVQSIQPPTINIRLGDRLYPTHETRVRPYFDEYAIPPEILSQDKDEIELPDYDVNPSTSKTIPAQTNSLNYPPAIQSTITSAKQTIIPRNSVSKVLSGNFKSSHQLNDDTLLAIEINENVFINIQSSGAGKIDSDFITLDQNSTFVEDFHHTDVHITTVEDVSKSLQKLPAEDQENFRKAKEEEIKFLIENDVVKPIPESHVPHDQEIQILRWVLNIKRNPTSKLKVRHRARLVSASNLSTLRHSVTGNAPTIAMSSFRAVLSVLPTWDIELRKVGDRLVLRLRDVTKSYLQSKRSQRLIYYYPPSEFFQIFVEFIHHLWQAIRQLYGDVEAGRYWHHTFIPWLVNNIFKVQQSIYDPSLLIDQSKHAILALCTDDIFSAMPKSLENEEEKIAKNFICRDAQQVPTDFKGVDINQNDTTISASQVQYLNNIEIQSVPSGPTKEELQRKLNDEETTTLKSIAWKTCLDCHLHFPAVFVLCERSATAPYRRPRNTIIGTSRHTPSSPNCKREMSCKAQLYPA